MGVRPILPGLALVLASCTADGGPTVHVFAASSLAGAFAAVEEAFEAAHPDVDVVLNLAGSPTLRAQILDGAPADVFAAASARHVEGVGDAPVVFAANRLQLVVPASNPGDVRGLGDLARDDLLVGLCAVEVPCGELAGEVLGRAGVAASVDTYEPDVRALLAKVVEGELDAGLVYRTDVLAAGRAVTGIDVEGPPTSYPVVTVGDDPLAAAFVELLLDDTGRSILAEHGFDLP